MTYMNISEKEPHTNELIICKEHGKVKYLGHGMIELPNGKIDKVEIWKYIKRWKNIFRIKHTDGIADIEAEGIIVNDELIIEYRFQGMTYGQILPLKKAGYQPALNKVS